MGVQDLQDYVETGCSEACKPVDLLKIARGLALSKAGKRRGPTNLCLVVDGESCLDRLYGGYYSDWACGGQWNRMVEFLGTLIQACHAAHMELVVFFDGALDKQQVKEWHKDQISLKRNAAQVFKHVNNKATPPPKVWWVPPMGLRSMLRMALRQYGVTVASSMDDHKQEVIGYCMENGFYGVIAQNAEYITFNPPHYYSSQHLKLTYKGCLETIEYVNDDIAKLLDLHPKRFCVLAALLGGHILTEEDLEQFLKEKSEMPGCDDTSKIPKGALVKGVVGFVRGLDSVEDLQAIGQQIFGSDVDKINRFKEAVQYYMNGTLEGYMRFRNRQYSDYGPGRQPGSYPEKKSKPSRPANSSSPKSKTEETITAEVSVKTADDDDEEEDDSSSDKGDNEDWGDGDSESKQKEIKPSSPYLETESGYFKDNSVKKDDVSVPQINVQEPGATGLEDKVSKLDLESDESKSDKKQKSQKSGSQPRKSDRLKVPPEVLRIATDRHMNGLMHPWVHQMLTKGEIKVDSNMEDENNRDFPPMNELFRGIRQNVFAILFDLNKQWAAYRKAMKTGTEPRPEKPDITFKEWLIPRGAPANPSCEVVHAEPLDWLAPGIHRLWLGQNVEDKNRRLRAFLSCMNSDVPFMLNTSYVPQHMILLCASLRYLVLYSDQRVLRKHELDAFLATAVSPLLHDVETMQEMKLPMINSRGVQLGAIFMKGIEHAVFANDAVGAPIPWHMCCPWLFFDGKLFHFKLLKANNNTPLIDICDGHVEQVMRVERMRQAILQGVPLDLAFAKPALPMMPPNPFGPPMYQGMNMRPAGAPPGMHQGGPPMNYGGQFGGPGNPQGPGRNNMAASRGRGHAGQVDSRGGQLQIAGVVVGNWGPNVNNQQGGRPIGGRGSGDGNGGGGRGGGSQQPHVTSVGPRRGGRGVVSTPAYRGGRGVPKSSNRGAPSTRVQNNNSPYNNNQNNYSSNYGRSNNMNPSGPGGDFYSNPHNQYGSGNSANTSSYGGHTNPYGGSPSPNYGSAGNYGTSNFGNISSNQYGSGNTNNYGMSNTNQFGGSTSNQFGMTSQYGGNQQGHQYGHNQYAANRNIRSSGQSNPSRGGGRIGRQGYESDVTRVTLEQRSRAQGGAGRGCTVENPINNVVSVHELMQQSPDLPDLHMNGNNGREIGTFADVDAELALADMKGGDQFLSMSSM